MTLKYLLLLYDRINRYNTNMCAKKVAKETVTNLNFMNVWYCLTADIIGKWMEIWKHYTDL